MDSQVLQKWNSYPGAGACLLGALLSFLPVVGKAQMCSAVFPSGLQTFDPAGRVEFGRDAQLLSDPDNSLETLEIKKHDDEGDEDDDDKKKDKNRLFTCGDQDCIALNQVSERIDPPPFKESESKRSIELDDKASFLLGSDGSNSYGSIELSDGAVLNVGDDFNEYRIEKLEIEEATVNLKPGDYWIEELEINNGAINVSGQGTVRLFVKKSTEVSESSLINSSGANIAGNPAKLIIYSFNALEVKDNSTVSALAYSNGEAELKGPAYFFGALAAQTIKLGENSQVTYALTDFADIDFGGLCENDSGENQAPVSDAGPDQSVVVGTTVTLDGSGSSDADGDALSFSWSLVLRPGGSNAALSDAASVMPTFVVDAPGSYVFSLTVNDGSEDSPADTVTITTLNSPPVADAGPDRSVFVTDTVILDGSGSSDVDGDALTFQWMLITVPASSAAVLSDPAAVQPGVEIDVPGTYIAQLVVNDGVVDSAPDTVAITTQNSTPIAGAGADQSVFVTDTVTLDGSGSTDVDGDALSFSWSLTVKPTGSVANLADASAVQPTFEVDLPGTYVAQLIVNDGTVDSAPDTVTITTQNSPPMADAGPDQKVFVGDTVSLDASRSGDVDGDPLNFTWALTAVPSGSTASLSDVTAVQPTFAVDLPDVYVAQLIANDGTVDSAPDTVTITTQNSPPVAEAGADQTVLVTDTVKLDGSGSTDIDGDGLTFTWSLTVVPSGSTAMLSDPGAVMPTFDVDLPGMYVAQLIINDGTVDSTPDTVTITTQNSPPVANAGADQTALVTETVTLDGRVSLDVDGDALTYAWSLVAVPPGSTVGLSDATALQPTFVVDRPGDYVAQLVVNDGTVDSGPDTVTVTTQNSRPVANAGLDQSVFVTDTVTLDGSGSNDVDGDPLTFDWSLIVKPTGSTALLSDPTVAQPNFIVDLPGTYIGQLIVNDGLLDSAPDTVAISAQNSPPVAQAGNDQNLLVGDTASLDGSGSSDVDGDPLTYQWVLSSAPAGSTATLTSTNTANTSIVPDLPGAYVLRLTVNDGAVDSVPDSVTVVAEVFVPLAITLNAPTDGAMTNQAQQTLEGSLSKPAQLTINGDVIPLGADRSFFHPVTLKEGENLFNLIATEAGGDTAELQVTLTLDTQPPEVPDAALIFIQPPTAGQVTIIGDPNSATPGSQVTVTNNRTGTTGFATTLPDGSFSFDFAAELGDSLSIVARDAAGNSSPILTIEVGADLPNLDAIGDQTAPLGQTLKFVVTASAPGNTFVALGVSPVPLPANVGFDISTGEFEFTPQPEQVGDIPLTFHARTNAGEVTETITVTVPAPDATAPTRFIGRVLDATRLNEGAVLPVVGARVSFIGTGQTAITDGNGNFAVTGLPAGDQILEINAATANVASGGAHYASFREKTTLIAHVDNVVVRPFSLPRVDGASMTTVVPVQTTVVKNNALGITLTVPPNTAFNADGSQFVGDLSISEVPGNLAPAALPDFIDPALLITLQPVGVTFAQPVPITFPNTFVNLPPGSEMNLWSLDPATGQFIIVGQGRISSDGQRVETVSGGVRATTWHLITPMPPDVDPDTPDKPDDDNDPCNKDPLGSTVNVQDGCLQTDFRLPAYRSLEASRSLRFIYKSRGASPHPVLPFNASAATRGFDATLGLRVGGVSQGEFPLGNGIGPATQRNAVAFSGDDFASGLYDYTIVASAKFAFNRFSSACNCIVSGTATLSTTRADEVRIVNQQNSDFGAGWQLDGLDRIHVNPAGHAFIVFGDGKTATFKRGAATGAFITPDGNYSTLIGNPDNSFTLTDKFGIKTEFSSAGRQTARVDRNGNRTEYRYDGLGRLTTLTDPVGKIASFDYAAGTGRLSAVTDPAGRVTRFEHNGVGDMTKVIFPDDSAKTFQYDHRHLMTAETDERGNTTTRRYDSLGRAIEATLPDGSTRATSASQSVGVVDFGDPTTGTELNPIQSATPENAVNRLVDANGNLEISTTDKFGRKTQVTDALGRVTHTESDKDGNPTKITRPNGSVVTMTYDARGNKLSETEAFNNATKTFTYDPQFSLVETNSDQLGNTTITIYDSAGNPIEARNALGHTTTRQHDSRGLMTQRTDPNGLVTTFTYTADGLVESITQTPPDGTPARTTRISYDNVGRMSRVQRPDGVVLALRYDERDRLTGTTDNLGQRIDFTYDKAGNIIQADTADPDSARVRSVARVFDTRSRLTATDSAGSISHLQLDNNGNVVRRTDPNGNAVSNVYDAANRLISVRDPADGMSRFDYDESDRLIRARAPNDAVTAFENDLLGRIIGEISPDRGQRASRYDKADNIIAVTDARGISANLSYDPLNRVTAITYPDAAENVTFTYDNCPFGIGRLCARTDQSGTYTFTYDAFGNRITETHTELSVTYTTAYTYDAGDKLNGMTLPSGRQISYSRDSVRRLSAIRTILNGVDRVVADTIGYRADDKLTGRRFGNGLVEQRNYDLQGRLLEQTLATTDARSYRYDANGNVLERTATPQNNVYGYDSLDRLIADTMNSRSIQLDYDANGNRRSRAANDGAFGEVYSYPQATNLLVMSDRTDASAAQTPSTPTQTERTFSYNNAGRLFQVFDNGVLAATYVYNGKGLRTRKVTAAGTTLYHYDPAGQLIAETREDGTLIRDYIWQDNELLAQIDVQGTSEALLYLHTDHLSAPRLATDESGRVIWRWEGEAFGVTPAEEDVDGDGNSITLNVRFPGQYYDQETGLHYNYFRYYDPGTGRYLTSDPIGLQGGLNTYVYAESNPIRNIDPFGLESSTTRGLPRAPTPFDVFSPGSRANDAFVDSTTRMFSDIFGGDGNAEDAGEDAADELDDDAQCPGAEDNGHGPNCQEIGRRCGDKCIEKYNGKGEINAWVAVCKAACMRSRGCSPFQDPSLF